MVMHANMQPSLSASPSSISTPHTYARWPSCAAAADDIHVKQKSGMEMNAGRKKKKVKADSWLLLNVKKVCFFLFF